MTNRRESGVINNLLTNINSKTNNGTLNTFKRTQKELNRTISIVANKNNVTRINLNNNSKDLNQIISTIANNGTRVDVNTSRKDLNKNLTIPAKMSSLSGGKKHQLVNGNLGNWPPPPGPFFIEDFQGDTIITLPGIFYNHDPFNLLEDFQGETIETLSGTFYNIGAVYFNLLEDFQGETIETLSGIFYSH